MYDVCRESLSPISLETYELLEMKYHCIYGFEMNIHLVRYGRTFVNWGIVSRTKNGQGRLPLFTACEKGLQWSQGLYEIVEGYGAAIEGRDESTGLEAFILAAVEPTSCSLETVFSLLQDHPAAINPYVTLPTIEQ